MSDRDFADYRARMTGAGRGAALGEQRLAQGVEELPALAEAVQQGALCLEHATTVTRWHKTASREVRDALDGGGLEELVAKATGRGWSAPELGTAARAWAAQVDAEAAQRVFDAAHRRRAVRMRKQAGGVVGEFFLDPVAGEQLRTALEAVAGRPGADDERTREQRMADALGTMAARTLQVGADRIGAQVRPHICLLVTEQTWTGILARRHTTEPHPDAPSTAGPDGPSTACPDGASAACPDGSSPGSLHAPSATGPDGASATGPGGSSRVPWPDVAAGQLEDGTIVPLGELERLMCDSEVTRMVMSAQGVPLDMGRTQRTYTKELRRAVLARDRRCMWPTCRIRASWAEVHHITWFSRGGVTSLAQGICLCSFHHHLVHCLDVQITALPDGFDFHHPDGTHLGTSRRHPLPEPLLPHPPDAHTTATAAGPPAAATDPPATATGTTSGATRTTEGTTGTTSSATGTTGDASGTAAEATGRTGHSGDRTGRAGDRTVSACAMPGRALGHVRVTIPTAEDDRPTRMRGTRTPPDTNGAQGGPTCRAAHHGPPRRDPTDTHPRPPIPGEAEHP
ncbi:MAG TPA: DUF222 domain-containing protein, partial [Actinomycetaceae bacterium]|nr:DUF222 domain-containing protein [Actinomycetaceae bacterium]